MAEREHSFRESRAGGESTNSCRAHSWQQGGSGGGCPSLLHGDYVITYTAMFWLNQILLSTRVILRDQRPSGDGESLLH